MACSDMRRPVDVTRLLVFPLIAATVLLATGIVPLRARDLSAAISYLYSSVSIQPPTASQMTVCYGFVCRRRMVLDFTESDRKQLTLLFAGAKASAEVERRAVQQAMVWFDKRVGPVIGTDKRIARADFRYFQDQQNFDCWDTTRNATSLLLVLQDWGLLRHHTIGDPVFRGNVFVLQTPHNSAVLIERATGSDWVVDMWTRSYAQLPDVQRVATWMKED
jgi:hypothetical protein